jgi:glycerophosphoryl diester phosphodiesterase
MVAAGQLSWRLMQLIAHRGGAGLRVENTLAAFERAIALGAHGAELDVHLTCDGQVVVHHDPVLNPGYCRRVGGDWIGDDEAVPIAESTLADLQCYEIGVPKPGSDYAARFDRITPMPSQHVPLLRDVIRLVKARSPRFKLVIEIKASYLDADKELWRPLVDAVLDVVAQEQLFDRAILCSFDWRALLHARQLKPRLVTWFTSSPLSWLGEETPPVEDIPPNPRHLEAIRALHRAGDAPWFAGFDPRRFTDGYPEAIAAAGGNAWLLYYRDTTHQTQRELASRGLESAAWSVNLQDKGQLARLVRIGVDNLLVDYPDVDIKAMSQCVATDDDA